MSYLNDEVILFLFIIEFLVCHIIFSKLYHCFVFDTHILIFSFKKNTPNPTLVYSLHLKNLKKIITKLKMNSNIDLAKQKVFVRNFFFIKQKIMIMEI